MKGQNKFLLSSVFFSLAFGSSTAFAFCNSTEEFGAAAMAISNNHAFIANGDTTRGVTVCDINGKTISNCVATSSVISEQSDIKISGNVAYVSNMCAKSITTCDVVGKDLQNCQNIKDPSFTSPYSTLINGSSIYVVNHAVPNQEYIVACTVNGKNVSNCANAALFQQDPYFMASAGQYAFVVNHDGSVSGCDLESNSLSNCDIALQGVPYPDPNMDAYYSIFISDGYAYITDMSKTTVTVCSVQGKTLSCGVAQPTPASFFPVEGSTKTVVINNNTAYFTYFEDNSIVACDVTDGTMPQFTNCVENLLPNIPKSTV